MSRVAFFNIDQVEHLLNNRVDPPKFEQAATWNWRDEDPFLAVPLPQELGVPFGCSEAHGLEDRG